MVNEYEPWKSEGITEVEYWKKRYIETRTETHSLSAENSQLISAVKALTDAHHDLFPECKHISSDDAAFLRRIMASSKTPLQSAKPVEP